MKKQIKIYISIIILFFVFSITPVFAEVVGNYHALEPGVFSSFAQSDTGTPLQKFFGQVFKFGIAAAVALALIMIIWGGIEYMTSDAWYNKEEGITKIKNALVGLGIALASYLILFIVNPCLVVFNADPKSCTTTNTFLNGVSYNYIDKNYAAEKIPPPVKTQVVDGKTMPKPIWCSFKKKKDDSWFGNDAIVKKAPETITAWYRVYSYGNKYNEYVGPYWFADDKQNSYSVEQTLIDALEINVCIQGQICNNLYFKDNIVSKDPRMIKNILDELVSPKDGTEYFTTTYDMVDAEKCQEYISNYDQQLRAYTGEQKTIEQNQKK